MPRLEELLKSKGYSATELETLAPLLSDAKFRSTLESSFDEVEQARVVAEQEASMWANWRQDEALPKIDKALKDAQDARAEAAGWKARLTTAQEQGLVRVAQDEGHSVPQSPSQAHNFDPTKFITQEQLNERQTQFADLEGDAIALAQDVSAEYQELFGKSLSTYVAADGSRGFRALRKEAVKARTPVDLYVAQKFNYSGRRAELSAAEQKRVEEQIRADERSKVQTEYGYPMNRPPQSSRSSSLPRPAGTEGKQPWELDSNARAAERVERALKNLVQ